jgi:hypothetical protein
MIDVIGQLLQDNNMPDTPTARAIYRKMLERDDTQVYRKPWVGLTDVEIHRTTVLMGFNPEWKTEIGMAHAIVRNLEAKLKEKNT